MPTARQLDESGQRYVPAAGRAGLTWLYDPISALTMRERTWRPVVVERVLGGAPRTIVDVGCGTGSLSVPLSVRAPETRVIGIDGDTQALRRAAAKARRHSATATFTEATVDRLPLDDAVADCVVCSLVFHHLTAPAKRGALDEMRRVLRPGGELVIVDWGRPVRPLSRLGFAALRRLDGLAQTADHASGAFAGLVAEGFPDVEVEGGWDTVFGRLELLTAAAPY